MRIQMSQEDAYGRLRPHHKAIRETVWLGFRKFERVLLAERGDLAASFSSLTKSMILHDHVVEAARDHLPAFDHLVTNRVHLFQLADVVLRIKKLGQDGLPCNASTNHNQKLCNGGDQETLFEEVQPLYLTLGYEVKPDWTDISSVSILCMASEEKTQWSYIVPTKDEGVPIQGYIPQVVPPMPKPIVIPKPKVAIRKPKSG